MHTNEPAAAQDAHADVRTAFFACGEAAGSEYLRTGQSRAAAEVLDRVEAGIAARRGELASRLKVDHGDR